MPWLEANGTSLRYTLTGAGSQTLVLLHEAGGCLESFDDALPHLESRFRILRYDQRGFGMSEKVRSLEFDTVVDDLAGLLDSVGIAQPVHIAGCAMGGDFAVGFAARSPARVASLVLTSPTIGDTSVRLAPSLDRGALAEREGVRAVMDAGHDRSYPEALRALDRERFHRYQARWVCNAPHSLTALARMAMGVNLTSSYPRIVVPCLVVGAKHDSQRPPEVAERVAASLANARYLIADTGHFMNVETPELFAKTVLDFLSNLR
jgi:3-oxoadipate enol-lactonase